MSTKNFRIWPYLERYGLCRCNELRISRCYHTVFRVNPKSSDQCPRKRWGDTDTEIDGGRDESEAATRQGIPGATRRQEGLPQLLQRAQLLTPEGSDFQPLDQTEQFCVLSNHQVCDTWSSRNIFWLLLYFLFPLPSFLFYSTYLLLSHVCGQRGKKSTQVWMSKLITEYTILQNVWWYLDHKWLLRSKTISMSQIGNITLQSQSVCLVT